MNMWLRKLGNIKVFQTNFTITLMFCWAPPISSMPGHVFVVLEMGNIPSNEDVAQEMEQYMYD